MPLPSEHAGSYDAYRTRLERTRTGGSTSSEEKARAGAKLIRKTSARAAVITLQPVPFADAVILPPIHHHMVRAIARIHGCHLDDRTERRMFRAIRSPMLASQTTIAVAKLIQMIPFAPEAIAVSVAYALTHAIGEASDQYLSSRDVPVDEMKARFETIYKERFGQAFRVKRDQLDALFRRPETRKKIEELSKAHRDGKLDEAEEAQRMDAILRGSGRPTTR